MTPPKKPIQTLKVASISPKNKAQTTAPKPSSIKEKGQHVFEKFKKHFEPEKVDAFQEKWLAIPENRKKYEKIKDLPQVAVEEILAMTNDLIDYVQGEKTGKSKLIEKLKTGFSRFFKNPAQFVQDRAEGAKEKAMELKEVAQEKAGQLKETSVEKMSAMANEVKNSTQKKLKKVSQKSRKVAKSSVKNTVAKVKIKAEKTSKAAKKVTKPGKK